MRCIDQLIRPLMRKAGFRLRGTTWSRIKDDFIQVLNFQKSMFGDIYYLNLAFARAEGMVFFPSAYKYLPEYRYPIRIRAEHIPFLETTVKSYYFDSAPTEQMKESVKTVIERCILFLDGYSVKDRFFSFFKDNLHLTIVWEEKQKLIEEGTINVNLEERQLLIEKGLLKG